MEWWKANRHRSTVWEKVNNIIREDYDDHYKPNRVLNKISDVKQTGTVQKYLNDIDRLNICAKITNHHLMHIILNSISARLRQPITYYKNLHCDPSEWKEKLLHMDFITTEFQKKEQENQGKG